MAPARLQSAPFLWGKLNHICPLQGLQSRIPLQNVLWKPQTMNHSELAASTKAYAQ